MENQAPCHVMDGAVLQYTYNELGTVIVEFYDGLVRFEWLDGPLCGEAGRDFAYHARQLDSSRYLVNWHEPDAHGFVTLYIDLEEKRVHSSVLASYATADEKVLFHEAVLQRREGNKRRNVDKDTRPSGGERYQREPSEGRGQTDNDIERIEALHAMDEEAAKSQDRVALNRLVTEDVVFLPPGEKIVRGKQPPAPVAPAIEILEYTFEWEELQLLGNYAYEWGHLDRKAKELATGEMTTSRFGVMRILKRDESGDWKIHRSIWNEAPCLLA